MDAYSQKLYRKIWFILRLTLKDHFSAFKVDFLGFPPYMCTTAIFADFVLTRHPLAKSVLAPHNQ